MDEEMIEGTELPEKKYLRRIGALWVKKTEQGMTYMTGELECLDRNIRIVVFKNDKKETNNHPDYRMMVEVEK